MTEYAKKAGRRYTLEQAAQVTAKHLVADLQRKCGGGWNLLGASLQEALALTEVLHRFTGRTYEGSTRTAHDLVEEMSAVKLAVMRLIDPGAFTDAQE